MSQYHIPEKEEGELLTINGYPEVGEPCIFVKGYLFIYVLYFLNAKYRSTDTSEYQVAEERDPDLN